jgi:orotate phosphoribosyltransferase
MTISDQPIAEQTAAMLLDCGAVKLNLENPFIWASGWKSPIYCDNRVTLSFPDVRNFIKHNLTNEVAKHFPTVEAVAGVATAGIPQGVLVADEIGLPFAYVRAEAKSHGMKNLIEGKLESGSQVVVIEDLISTGSSSLKAIDALRQAEIKVLGLIAVFSYSFPQAAAAFIEAKVPTFSITNYETLLQVALSKNLIQAEQLQTLNFWRQSPDLWPA